MGPKDDDAFAATVTPPPARPPPTALATSELESQQTMAVPSVDGRTMPAPTQEVAETRLPTVPYSHFRTDHEIARGGMGKIVAADDVRLGRQVALKVLLEPAGDQLERFKREALITARLQHPGIVPVYEAGQWPSGEPFFAMKLVDGDPLDKVIAEAKTLEERLALVQRVIAAVDAIAYAHSRRIVHRDLKPANVLIGKFGETVVIDWGLAKDLDSAEASVISVDPRPRAPNTHPHSATTTNNSMLTVAGAVMGTPAYMAPEQARGEPVDQRADVFALGAMLYHLLAGVPPYKARTATDVIAAAALGRVTPLFEHERRAPKDLVAIVDRAMAQEVADRYPDAGAVAEELRRFLTGQLVAAHRYTALQRVGRFVRKHRAAVTIGALAFVVTTVGGTAAIADIVSARDAAKSSRDDALARKRAAETLIDAMFKDVERELRAIGRIELLSKLGKEVDDYFGELDHGDGLAPDDMARMAQAVDLVGEADLKSGRSDDALQSWTVARARLAALVAAADALGADLDTRKQRIRLAHLDYEIGTVYQQRGRVPEAITYLERSVREYDELRAEDRGKDRETLLGGATPRDRLGDLLRNQGKVDAAFEEYASAKADREAAVGLGGGAPSDELDGLATSHMKVGTVYYARGDSAGALAEYQAALKQRLRLVDDQPNNLDYEHQLLDVEDSLAELQRQLGDDKAAIKTYRDALPVVAELIVHDRANTLWSRQRGILLADLGFALLDSGDFPGGLAELDQAITLQKGQSEGDPKTSTWKVDLSRSYTRQGDGYFYLGRPADGLAAYGLALDIRTGLHDHDPKSVPFRRSLAWSYAKLANGYRDTGDPARSIASSEQALELRRQLVTESPGQGAFKDELAMTEVELGRVLIATDATRAGELIASGIARSRALVDADPINNDLKGTLVLGLLAQAEAARARSDAPARGKALAEALAVAGPAAARAPQNAHWPGFLGEIHAGRADLAPDPAAARTEWLAARDVLSPLAGDHRLPAMRRPILDLALAHLR